MREEITYIADDGREFADYEECRKYENNILISEGWGFDAYYSNFKKITDIENLDNAFFIHITDLAKTKSTFDYIYDEYGWLMPNIKFTENDKHWYHYDNDEWIDFTEQIKFTKIAIDALNIEIQLPFLK